jgi:hypothetical protein
MSLATFDHPPFETLVDPVHGIVLGYAWGESVEGFLNDHPYAELVTDDADIQEYVVPIPFGFCGLESYSFFKYQLDCLVAISIRWGLEGPVEIDAPCAQCIAMLANRWFTEEFREVDDGFFQLEQDTTRFSLDWMDQKLSLEEVLE